MKRLAIIGLLALLLAGCPYIPRDEHPERTPSPLPSPEHSLRTGRQPASEVTR